MRNEIYFFFSVTYVFKKYKYLHERNAKKNLQFDQKIL